MAVARWIVKFGGTSLADFDRVAKAADRIAALQKQGHACVVVLSAMGKTTDELCEQAYRLHDKPSPREWDALLVNGENLSVTLMAMALQARGCQARSFCGHQTGIMTNGCYGEACITGIKDGAYQAALAEGVIPVVAGFQGVDANGDINTLGRGGSDLTAVALAVALNADECRIYTDVDGVHTADPRIVSGAEPIRQISFEAMHELASLGAGVMQARAVELASRYRVPLRICSSFTDDPGTFITDEVTTMEQPSISGITSQAQQVMFAVVGLPADHEITASVVERLVEAEVPIDMIVQTQRTETVDLSFSLSRSHAQSTEVLLKDYCRYLGDVQIYCRQSLAKLSVVGVGLSSHGVVIGKILRLLAELRVSPLMMSTSEIKLSVLVEEKFLELAMRALHQNLVESSPD